MKPEVGVMGGGAGRLGMQAPLEAGNEKETNPLSPHWDPQKSALLTTLV